MSMVQYCFTSTETIMLVRTDNPARKLQALVYDILPSTTVVFSYAIGSRKLSGKEQFFVVLNLNSSKFVQRHYTTGTANSLRA